MESEIKVEVIEDTELEIPDVNWDPKAEGTIGNDPELAKDSQLNSNAMEDIHHDMETEIFIEVQPIEDDMASDPLWLLATVEQPSAESYDDMIEIKVEPGSFSEKSSNKHYKNISTSKKTSTRTSLSKSKIKSGPLSVKQKTKPKRKEAPSVSGASAAIKPANKSRQKKTLVKVGKPSKTRTTGKGEALSVSDGPASSLKSTSNKSLGKKASVKGKSGPSSGESSKSKLKRREAVSDALTNNKQNSKEPDDIKTVIKVESDPLSGESSNIPPSGSLVSDAPRNQVASSVSGGPASSLKFTSNKFVGKKTSVKGDSGPSSGESSKKKLKRREVISETISNNVQNSGEHDATVITVESDPLSGKSPNSPTNASAVSDAPAGTKCPSRSFQKTLKVEPDPFIEESSKPKHQAPSISGASVAMKSPSDKSLQTKTTVEVESDPLSGESSKTRSKGKYKAVSVSGTFKQQISKKADVIETTIKVESDTSVKESLATDPNGNDTASSVSGSLTTKEPPSHLLNTEIKIESESLSIGSPKTKPNRNDTVSGAMKSDEEQSLIGAQICESEEAIAQAKECIKNIAASAVGESSQACDLYGEFEKTSAHPDCKYTLEELKLMAERIPQCLGDEHRLLFIRECYKFGRDPNKWEWELYSEIEPDEQSLIDAKPHRNCKLTQAELKSMTKGVLNGDKRGTFMILTYHRGKDPAQLLKKLSQDTSPPWCGFVSGKHSWSNKYTMMSKAFPHLNCKHTLEELKRMAEHIPESFGIETRMKFIYRCYKLGKNPASEDWTQYNVNPFYEFEDLLPHRFCKHSIEELKRMAEKIPESFGLKARVQFVHRCYMQGRDPAKEDWTQYKVRLPKLIINNPYKITCASETGPNPYTEFKDTPPHKKCKYPLEKVIDMAEQIPESFGTETRTHFVRRCYKFGHDLLQEEWSKYFDLALIYPPVNQDDPYAEFNGMQPHQNCKLSLEEVKRLAEQIPQPFGIETRVKFIRRCYKGGKDPVAEDWTEYNMDPYFEIKERPVHKNNKFAYKGLKKIASQMIPESFGILPRLILVHRCYNLGKNPYKEDWRQYTPEQYTLFDCQETSETGNVSNSRANDSDIPFSEFEGMSPHPKCKQSLEELKRMAERIPESLGIETRVHFVRRCYRFGHDPATEDWTQYFKPFSIFPPVNTNNPYAEFKEVKPHQNCKLSLEELWYLAKQIPPSFGIETRVKFIRRCYRCGRDPSVEDWTQYNIDPFSEFEDFPPHRRCKHSLEEMKQMSERIPESFGIHTRVHFVRRCYRRGRDPKKEDWTQYNMNQYSEFQDLPPHEDCKRSLEELKHMAEQIPENYGIEARLHFVRRCYKDGKDPAKEDWKQYPSVCSKLAVLGGTTLEPTENVGRKRNRRKLRKNLRKREFDGSLAVPKDIDEKGPQNNFTSTDSSSACVGTSETAAVTGCPPYKITNLSSSQDQNRPHTEEGPHFINPPIVSNPYAEFDYISPHPNCKHSLGELKCMAEQLPEPLGIGARVHFVRECYQFGKPRVLQMGQSALNRNSDGPAPYSFNGPPFSFGPMQENNTSFNGGLSEVRNPCLAAGGTAWNHPFNSVGGPMLSNPPNPYPTGGPPFNPSSFPPPSAIGGMACNPANPYPSGRSSQFISTPVQGMPNDSPSMLSPAGQSLPPAPPFLHSFHSNYSATPSLPTGNQLSVPPSIFGGPPATVPCAPPSDRRLQSQAPPNVGLPRDSPFRTHPSRRNKAPASTYGGSNLVNYTTGNLRQNPCGPPHYPQLPTEMNNPNSHVTVETSLYIHQTDSYKLAELTPNPGSDPSSVSLKRKTNYRGAVPPKRPATNDKPHEVDHEASKDLNPVFIVPSGYPNVRLSEEQMDMLENGILEAVLEFDDASVKPTFSESFRSNGQYGFVCADEFTRNWLNGFLSTYRPWPNASLTILPKLSAKVRANAVLPLCKDDDSKVLNFIGKQNGRVKTSKWEVIERWDTSDSKTCITLMVDEESAKSLEVSNHINFKLGSGKITVSREGEEVGTMRRPAITPPPDVSSLKYELLKLNNSLPAASNVISGCSSSRLPPSLDDKERPKDDAHESGSSGRAISNQDTCGDNKHAQPSTDTMQHSARSPSPDKSSLKYELLKLKASLADKPSCVEYKGGLSGRESSPDQDHRLGHPSPSGQSSIRTPSPAVFNHSSSESNLSLPAKYKRKDRGSSRRKYSREHKSRSRRRRRSGGRVSSKQDAHWDQGQSLPSSRTRTKEHSTRTQSPDVSSHKVLKLKLEASLQDERRQLHAGGSSSGGLSTRKKRDRGRRHGQPSSSSSELVPSLQDERVREGSPLGIRSKRDRGRGRRHAQPSPSGHTMQLIRTPSPDVSSRSEGECTPSPTERYGKPNSTRVSHEKALEWARPSARRYDFF